MVTESDLLTVAEAARLLRVSRVTMHRWLKQGRLPSYRIGPRSIRVRREDVGRFLTPAQPEKSGMVNKGRRPAVLTAPRPLTEEEKRQGYEALEASRKLGERIRARLGGQPFEESWPMIREAREERSKQLL